jgi:hypothetical protein
MTPGSIQSVTDLLQAWASGDQAALDELLPLVYSIVAADSDDVNARAKLGNLAARRGDRAEAEQVDRWLTAREPLDNGAGARPSLSTGARELPDSWASARVP